MNRAGFGKPLIVNPTDMPLDLSIIVAPGWGENARVLEEFAWALHRVTGLPVVCINFPRWKLGHGPNETRRQVQYIHKVIKKLRIRQAHFVAHSASGPAVLKAVYMISTKVVSIQLFGCAGFFPGDDLAHLIKRVARKNLDNVRWALSTRRAKNLRRVFLGIGVGIIYGVLNPRKGLREVLLVPSASSFSDITAVSLLGIRIRVIFPEHDVVFPPSVRQLGCEVTVIPGLHDALYLDPGTSAFIVADFIAQLAKVGA